MPAPALAELSSMNRALDPRIASLCERAERLARHLEAQRLQLASLNRSLFAFHGSAATFAPAAPTAELSWR